MDDSRIDLIFDFDLIHSFRRSSLSTIDSVNRMRHRVNKQTSGGRVPFGTYWICGMTTTTLL
jgi:hypothetical protein